jgi:hypothetical protein
MSRPDRFAVLMSLAAVLLAYLVADRVFERMAHLEDEMAYIWQAQALTRGKLALPSPPEPKSFLVPFVVDHNGLRFGKYPPGWPAVLAIGELLGQRAWINPLLAGAGVWLTYLLGKKTMGETVGLLAAGLTLTSPFFLLNSGSLLSHPLGLVLSATFALAWLEAYVEPEPNHPWFFSIMAGLALGALALTRPFTALGVALPFALHGIYLLVRSAWAVRQRLAATALIALGLGVLLFGWQKAVTGDALLNPYTLWWSYDKVGFGPGYGRIAGGHTLWQAWINTRHSLRVGAADLFGWARLSWIFLPVGLGVVLFRRKAWLPVSVIFSLLILHLAYWIGSSLFGPRYYYEGLYSLTLLSAAGIAWLAGWPTQPGEAWKTYHGVKRWRPLAMAAILETLVLLNLFFYLPIRLESMRGLYNFDREALAPFTGESAQQYTPALVIVHTEDWTEYGELLELSNPFLDSPFVFVITRGLIGDQAVASHFPERKVFHYYPEEPDKLYTNSRDN